MDIEIPSWLQWVAPLAGGAWPQGSETGLAQLASDLRAGLARGLVGLIPDLARVRAQTEAVFSGQTARSVDAQFALLFDGDFSVDKLGVAGDALADSAEAMATEIQFSKMQILAMLAVAAVSIRMALAEAPWTSGASLGVIPAIEAATEQSIGRVVMLAVERIIAELADKLGSTMVARLLVAGVTAGLIGGGQDAALQGIQVLEGRRTGINVGEVFHAATSMAEAGVAGAITGGVVGNMLGEGAGTMERAIKGAVTGLASGEVANIAATLAGGAHLSTATFLGGVLGVAHGAMHGADGVHGTSAGQDTDRVAPVAPADGLVGGAREPVTDAVGKIDGAMPAARGMQTAAAESGVDGAHTGDAGVQPVSPVGRSGADASVVDRGEGRGPADALTKRQDLDTWARGHRRDPSDPPSQSSKLSGSGVTEDTSRVDQASGARLRHADGDTALPPAAGPQERPAQAASAVGDGGAVDGSGSLGEVRHVGNVADHGGEGAHPPIETTEPAAAEARGEDYVPRVSDEWRLSARADNALNDWRALRGMDAPDDVPADEPGPAPEVVADKPAWVDDIGNPEDPAARARLMAAVASTDFDTRLPASIELVYRETGMIPRREQIETAIGLYDGSSTELGPGGGKTVAGGMALAWLALDEGKASMFLHVRYLADEAHDQFEAVWSKYGITAVRWTSHGEHPSPDGPTAYFCTDAEDAHASQAGHETGSRTWIFDEVHRMDPDRSYSTVAGGDDQLAPAPDRAMAAAARDLVEKLLTEDDIRQSGRRDNPATLRTEALPTVRDALHEQLSQASGQDALDAALAERDQALAHDRAVLRAAALEDPLVQAAQTRLEDAHQALATAVREGKPVEDAQQAVAASQRVTDVMVAQVIDQRVAELDKAVADARALREAPGMFLDDTSPDGLSADGRRYLDAAITAHFDYDRNRYFVSDDNKIVLISPDTGDPEADKATGTHSHLPRDIDLALKAKEGLALTEVPTDAVRTTAEEHFGPQGGRGDHRVGMTGTGDRYPTVGARLGRLGFATMTEIPDHFEPLLFEHPDINGWPQDPERPWDVDAKLNYMLDQALHDHDEFRPVLLVLPNEIELLRMVEIMGARGIVPDNIVDAQRVYNEGPQVVQEVAAVAGGVDQITVATLLVGTGFDAKLGLGTRGLGGLAVHCATTDLPPEHRVQVGRRAARPGVTPNPGSARFYGSPDTYTPVGGDDLHPHDVVRYLKEQLTQPPAPDPAPHPHAAGSAAGSHNATPQPVADTSTPGGGAHGDAADPTSSAARLAVPAPPPAAESQSGHTPPVIPPARGVTTPGHTMGTAASGGATGAGETTSMAPQGNTTSAIGTTATAPPSAATDAAGATGTPPVEPPGVGTPLLDTANTDATTGTVPPGGTTGASQTTAPSTVESPGVNTPVDGPAPVDSGQTPLVPAAAGDGDGPSDRLPDTATDAVGGHNDDGAAASPTDAGTAAASPAHPKTTTSLPDRAPSEGTLDLPTTRRHPPPPTHATTVDLAAQAGRPEADSHPASRQDTAASDRPRQPADPPTKRQDPNTRPDTTRHAPRTGPRGRPAQLHRSGVARDAADDLQPAATHAPDPTAATEDIGVIKASHGDSAPGPGPAEPESHKAGGDGGDSPQHPRPGAAGGGAADSRGGGDGRDGDNTPEPDTVGSGDQGAAAGGGAGDGAGGGGGGTGLGADGEPEPLGDLVVGNVTDVARVKRLAAALSNMLTRAVSAIDERCRMRVFLPDGFLKNGELRFQDQLILWSEIHIDDERVGTFVMFWSRDDLGALAVHDSGLEIDDPRFVLQREEIYAAVAAELKRYYRQPGSGVDRIQFTRDERGGGHALARQESVEWDLKMLPETLESLRETAALLRGSLSPEGQRVLDGIVKRLHPTHPYLPKPYELAALPATQPDEEPNRQTQSGDVTLADSAFDDLGRRWLDATCIDLVEPLHADDADLHGADLVYSPRRHAELVGALQDAGIEVTGVDDAPTVVLAQVVAAVDRLREQGVAWGIEAISFGRHPDRSPASVILTNHGPGTPLVITSIGVDPQAEHVDEAIYAALVRQVIEVASLDSSVLDEVFREVYQAYQAAGLVMTYSTFVESGFGVRQIENLFVGVMTEFPGTAQDPARTVHRIVLALMLRRAIERLDDGTASSGAGVSSGDDAGQPTRWRNDIEEVTADSGGDAVELRFDLAASGALLDGGEWFRDDGAPPHGVEFGGGFQQEGDGSLSLWGQIFEGAARTGEINVRLVNEAEEGWNSWVVKVSTSRRSDGEPFDEWFHQTVVADLARRAYRSIRPDLRKADWGYAKSIGDLVDSYDEDAAAQLGEDFDGVCGRYPVLWMADVSVERRGGEFDFTGVIDSGDTRLGSGAYGFSVTNDGDSGLFCTYSPADIATPRRRMPWNRRAGEADQYSFDDEELVEIKNTNVGVYENLRKYLQGNGVHRIETRTVGDHGEDTYTFATRYGAKWNRDPEKLHESVENLKAAARALGDDAVQLLDEVMGLDLPELIDLVSELSAVAIGRELLRNTNVHVIDEQGEPDEPPAPGAPAQPGAGGPGVDTGEQGATPSEVGAGAGGGAGVVGEPGPDDADDDGLFARLEAQLDLDDGQSEFAARDVRARDAVDVRPVLQVGFTGDPTALADQLADELSGVWYRDEDSGEPRVLMAFAVDGYDHAERSLRLRGVVTDGASQGEIRVQFVNDEGGYEVRASISSDGEPFDLNLHVKVASQLQDYGSRYGFAGVEMSGESAPGLPLRFWYVLDNVAEGDDSAAEARDRPSDDTSGGVLGGDGAAAASGTPTQSGAPTPDSPGEPYGGAGEHSGDDGEAGGAGIAGHDDGPEPDDFSRRQAAYRDQDPAVRHADSGFAEPAGEVLDNASTIARVDQFAADLSGNYGPYRLQLHGAGHDGYLTLFGDIYNGDDQIGALDWSFYRDDQGNLVVNEDTPYVVSDPELVLGTQEFLQALDAGRARHYIRSGVDRIVLALEGSRTYARAHEGLSWNRDPDALQWSLDSIKDSASRLAPRLSPQAQGVLDEIVARLDPTDPRLPEPGELASLTAPGVPDLGERLLDGTNVSFVKYLLPEQPPEHSSGDERVAGGAGDGTAQPRADVEDVALPAERVVDNHQPSEQPSEDRQRGRGVRRVHEVLTAMFGRPIGISDERRRAGVWPHDVISAAGCDSEADTIDEAGGTLGCLGRGSVAILSRFSYADNTFDVILAVNVRGVLHYYDPGLDVFSNLPPRGWVLLDAGYLDGRGDPLLPADGPRYIDIRGQIQHGARALPPSGQSELQDETATVLADFASAMNRPGGRLEPGTDEANRLAERHFALSRRFTASYDYTMHRYDAATNVTHGKLFDPFGRLPYREIAPELGRYMAQLIVAHAEHYLAVDERRGTPEDAGGAANTDYRPARGDARGPTGSAQAGSGPGSDDNGQGRAGPAGGEDDWGDAQPAPGEPRTERQDGDANEPATEREFAQRMVRDAREHLLLLKDALAEWLRALPVDVDVQTAVSSPQTLLDALVRDDVRLAAERAGEKVFTVFGRDVVAYLKLVGVLGVYEQWAADLVTQERFATPEIDPIGELENKLGAAQELVSLLPDDFAGLLAGSGVVVESGGQPWQVTWAEIAQSGPAAVVELLLGRGLFWRNRGLAEELVEAAMRLGAAAHRVDWLQRALEQARRDQGVGRESIAGEDDWGDAQPEPQDPDSESTSPDGLGQGADRSDSGGGVAGDQGADDENARPKLSLEQWLALKQDEVAGDAARVWYAPRGVTGTPGDDLLGPFLSPFFELLPEGFTIDNRLCGLNELLYAHDWLSRTTNGSSVELPDDADDVAMLAIMGFGDRALAQRGHTNWVEISATDTTADECRAAVTGLADALVAHADLSAAVGLALVAFENPDLRSGVSEDERKFAVNTHLVTATHARNRDTSERELVVHELVPTGDVDERGRPSMQSVEYLGTHAHKRLAQLSAGSRAVHALQYNNDGAAQEFIGPKETGATKATPDPGPRTQIGQHHDHDDEHEVSRDRGPFSVTADAGSEPAGARLPEVFRTGELDAIADWLWRRYGVKFELAHADFDEDFVLGVAAVVAGTLADFPGLPLTRISASGLGGKGESGRTAVSPLTIEPFAVSIAVDMWWAVGAFQSPERGLQLVIGAVGAVGTTFNLGRIRVLWRARRRGGGGPLPRHPMRITLERNLLRVESKARKEWVEAQEAGRLRGSWEPAANTMLHELSHAVWQAGGKHAAPDIVQALWVHFLDRVWPRNVIASNEIEAFWLWFRSQFSRYGVAPLAGLIEKNADLRQLRGLAKKLEELFTESFVAVRNPRIRATDGESIAYRAVAEWFLRNIPATPASVVAEDRWVEEEVSRRYGLCGLGELEFAKRRCGGDAVVRTPAEVFGEDAASIGEVLLSAGFSSRELSQFAHGRWEVCRPLSIESRVLDPTDSAHTVLMTVRYPKPGGDGVFDAHAFTLTITDDGELWLHESTPVDKDVKDRNFYGADAARRLDELTAPGVQFAGIVFDEHGQAERPLAEDDEIDWEREEGVDGRIGSAWQPRSGDEPRAEREYAEHQVDDARQAGKRGSAGELDAEPEHRPFRLEDYGEWDGYDTVADIATALEDRRRITVNLNMPDSALDAARDVARAIDWFLHNHRTRVNRFVVGDPMQTLIDDGVANADAAKFAGNAAVCGPDSDGEHRIILNNRLSDAEWAQQRATAKVLIHPMVSAVFGDRPVLTLTLDALMAGLALSAPQRLDLFADRVLREHHRRVDGGSEDGSEEHYLGWRAGEVPDGGQGGASWDPMEAAIVAAAAVACNRASGGQRVLYKLLHQEARAAAQRQALLREGGPALVDRRGPIDLGACENLAALAEQMKSALRIELSGLDREGLNLELVREFCQGLADVVSVFPEARPWFGVRVDDTEAAATTTWNYELKRKRLFARSIVFGARNASAEVETIHRREMGNWLTGYFFDCGASGVGAVHETGHALAYNGPPIAPNGYELDQARPWAGDYSEVVAEAPRALEAYYELTRGSREGFEQWLRLGLSSRCFHAQNDPDSRYVKGEFDPVEAVPEGHTGVWHYGRAATEPAKVLSVLLLRKVGVDEARIRWMLQQQDGPLLGLSPQDGVSVFGESQQREPGVAASAATWLTEIAEIRATITSLRSSALEGVRDEVGLESLRARYNDLAGQYMEVERSFAGQPVVDGGWRDALHREFLSLRGDVVHLVAAETKPAELHASTAADTQSRAAEPKLATSTPAAADPLTARYGAGLVPVDAAALTTVQLQKLANITANQLNSTEGRTEALDVKALLESTQSEFDDFVWSLSTDHDLDVSNWHLGGANRVRDPLERHYVVALAGQLARFPWLASSITFDARAGARDVHAAAQQDSDVAKVASDVLAGKTADALMDGWEVGDTAVLALRNFHGDLMHAVDRTVTEEEFQAWLSALIPGVLDAGAIRNAVKAVLDPYQTPTVAQRVLFTLAAQHAGQPTATEPAGAAADSAAPEERSETPLGADQRTSDPALDPYPERAAMPLLGDLLEARLSNAELREALAPLSQRRYGKGQFGIRITASYGEDPQRGYAYFDDPDSALSIYGDVVDAEGRAVGSFEYVYGRDAAGKLVAHHWMIDLHRRARGQGFARALNTALEHWYRRSGVDRIELDAMRFGVGDGLSNGSRIWAIAGYDWNPEGLHDDSGMGVLGVQRRMLAAIQAVRATASERDREELSTLAEQFAGDPADYPTPAEVIWWPFDDRQLGGRIMSEVAAWGGVYELLDCDTEADASLSAFEWSYTAGDSDTAGPVSWKVVEERRDGMLLPVTSIDAVCDRLLDPGDPAQSAYVVIDGEPFAHAVTLTVAGRHVVVRDPQATIVGPDGKRRAYPMRYRQWQDMVKARHLYLQGAPTFEMVYGYREDSSFAPLNLLRQESSDDDTRSHPQHLIAGAAGRSGESDDPSATNFVEDDRDPKPLAGPPERKDRSGQLPEFFRIGDVDKMTKWLRRKYGVRFNNFNLGNLDLASVLLTVVAETCRDFPGIVVTDISAVDTAHFGDGGGGGGVTVPDEADTTGGPETVGRVERHTVGRTLRDRVEITRSAAASVIFAVSSIEVPAQFIPDPAVRMGLRVGGLLYLVRRAGRGLRPVRMVWRARRRAGGGPLSRYVCRIELNREWLVPDSETREKLDIGVDVGMRRGVAGNPAAATLLHEMAHAVWAAGGYRAADNVMRALCDYYDGHYAPRDTDLNAQIAGFWLWFGTQFSHYGAENFAVLIEENVDPRGVTGLARILEEAFAESFVAVRTPQIQATEGENIAYRTVAEWFRDNVPNTPPSVIVEQPELENVSQQFGLSDLGELEFIKRQYGGQTVVQTPQDVFGDDALAITEMLMSDGFDSRELLSHFTHGQWEADSPWSFAARVRVPNAEGRYPHIVVKARYPHPDGSGVFDGPAFTLTASDFLEYNLDDGTPVRVAAPRMLFLHESDPDGRELLVFAAAAEKRLRELTAQGVEFSGIVIDGAGQAVLRVGEDDEIHWERGQDARDLTDGAIEASPQDRDPGTGEDGPGDPGATPARPTRPEGPGGTGSSGAAVGDGSGRGDGDGDASDDAPLTAGTDRGGSGGDSGGDGGGAGNELGGEDDSHPVERYFETHSPSGDAIENLQPGDILRHLAAVVTQIYGHEIHLEPGSDTPEELLEAAGIMGQFGTCAEVEETLSLLGPDSSAIVSVLAVLPTGWHVRVFLPVNIGGKVHYYDPAMAVLTDWRPYGGQTARIGFGYLDAHGDPLLPLNEVNDRRLTERSQMDEAFTRLSEADSSRLMHDNGALTEDFGSAMARGVPPGSEQANALAQRHFDLAQRVFADYSYESHRADGRWLLADGALRDPYEWHASGLARYVRDVIVANAEHHLGQPDYGRDGEVSSVERYFQTHPPSGEGWENWQAEANLRPPGIAQRDVAEVVSQIYGREVHLEPGSQTVDDLLRAAGSESMGASYAEVGDMVRYLGPGSSAIVASTLSYGIASPVLDDASIIFLAVNIGGEVHFYDINNDVLGNWPPPWGEDDVSSTVAGYLDAHGDPVLPLGELNERRLTVRSLMDEAMARMSGADGLQLSSDIWALTEDFGAAMAGDVAPGSEQANALAQRHFDLARRLFADYSYESHRADGHWLLMDAALRDPYEWLAPGLARYMRDVIVANADHHLGPPR